MPNKRETESSNEVGQEVIVLKKLEFEGWCCGEVKYVGFNIILLVFICLRFSPLYLLLL